MSARIALALWLLAVSPVAGESLPTGRFVEKIVCRSDPARSYALYLPSGYTPARTWPALLVFDPRGRSVLAGEVFREGAEAGGWIILSSNDTRSDDAGDANAKAMRAMWAELDRYPVDARRIYAAGFSGGATVAWYLARITGKVAGVISSGGTLPPDFDMANLKFAHFAAAGTTDFNYLEMRRIDALCEKEGMAHRSENFEGRHQWMPKEMAAEAIGWLDLVAMKEARKERDPALIERAWLRELEAARELEAKGETLVAARRYRTIERTFSGLRNTDEATRRAMSLESSPAFRNALRQEKSDQEYERSMHTAISRSMPELSSDDPPPLPQALNALRVPALQREAERGGTRSVTARRVLEWVFTETSSYLARDLLAAGRNRQAVRTLEVSAAIRRDAPVVWYNLACARSRTGDRKGSLAALSSALDAGFTDLTLLRSDPDLAPLRSDPAFESLARRLSSDR